MLKVTVDSRVVRLKLGRVPEDLHDRLRATVASLTARLYGAIVGREPERTGKLKSRTRQNVIDRPHRITGRVRISAQQAKAAALEYGAHKAGPVSEHEMRLDHIFGRLVAPRMVMVRRHNRTPNVVARRFLRGGFEEMLPDIEAELQATLEGTLAAEDL